MMTFRLFAVAGIVMALSGCVLPFGYSTGPGDDRSPYLSNYGDRDAAPDPSDQFQPGPADNLH
jgi:hypothetical protein